MKYLLMKYSLDEKVVGTYPQTEAYYDGYDTKAPTSFTNLKSEKLPKFQPDLRFKLNKRALLTDVIKVSNINTASGLFVNKKTMSELSDFNLDGYSFYEGFLENNKSQLKYFWLHIVDSSFEYVDFKLSLFYTLKLFFKKDQEIEIQDESDLYHKLERTGKLIFAEKLKMKTAFYKNPPDIFRYPIIQNPDSFFISEKLASVLIKNKTSGIDIIDQNIIC